MRHPSMSRGFNPLSRYEAHRVQAGLPAHGNNKAKSESIQVPLISVQNAALVTQEMAGVIESTAYDMILTGRGNRHARSNSNTAWIGEC